MSAQIPNYGIIDLIYQYYDARMALEYLDHEGEVWSDGVVQTCLPKLLYNIQLVNDHQKAAMSSLYMPRDDPESS